MTAAAIARLAGVGRAAVSNWRRRYPDFPKPVAGRSGSPMFSRTQVEEWLRATGKADQLATAGRTETGTQRLTDLPETSSWFDLFAVEERSIADLGPGELLAKVMASLLPRTVMAARSPDADEAELPVVIDPACQEAIRLLAVADRFGNRVRLVGQEIQESAADLAALNLRSGAHDVEYEIQVGDSLLDNQLTQISWRGSRGCLRPTKRPVPMAVNRADHGPKMGVRNPGAARWRTSLGPALLCPSSPGRRRNSYSLTRTCFQASSQHIRTELVRSGVSARRHRAPDRD